MGKKRDVNTGEGWERGRKEKKRVDFGFRKGKGLGDETSIGGAVYWNGISSSSSSSSFFLLSVLMRYSIARWKNKLNINQKRLNKPRCMIRMIII